MFLDALIFPTTIAFGATGGPRFAVTVADSPSGAEAAMSHWPVELGAWELAQVNRSAEETILLITCFEVACGRAHSFRFFDHDDHVATEELLGTGDGTETVFQLLKTYPEDVLTYTRTLTKPIAGTVTCALNGTPTTAFTINHHTGRVTLDTAPGMGVEVTASCQFHVPVRFGMDTMHVVCLEPTGNPWAPGGTYTWSDIRLVEVRSEEAAVGYDVPALLGGVDLLGSTTTLLLLPHRTFFNSLMIGARSLTLCVITSAITGNGTLWLMQEEGTGPVGASLALATDGTVTGTMGPGAATFTAAFSVMTGWSCGYNQGDNPQTTASFVPDTAIDQAKLALYIFTFDWYNRALYVSGSVSGYAAYSQGALTYNTCFLPDIFTEPTLVTLEDRFYTGRDGGGILSDPPSPFISFDIALGYGITARLYELVPVISHEPMSPRRIVRTIHTPLLAFFQALVAGEPVPDTLGLASPIHLWYRDRYDITLYPPAIATWSPFLTVPPLADAVVPFAVVNNPTSNLSGSPEQFAITTLPPLALPLTLAPVP